MNEPKLINIWERLKTMNFPKKFEGEIKFKNKSDSVIQLIRTRFIVLYNCIVKLDKTIIKYICNLTIVKSDKF